jgi:molybdopterin converting factor small subunit
MLIVRFSGSLRDIAGCTEMQIELPSSRRLSDVLNILADTWPGILGSSADYQWRYGSSHVVVGVNNRIVDDANMDLLLSEGDEIGLMPPLGGGSLG